MTAPASVKLELWLGSMIATPASAAIMERLDSVEVTCADDAPRSFKLTFKADRAAGPAADFALLSSGDLAPWNRVIVSVGLGSESQILIDGFITQHELSHDGPFGSAVLNIIGEDVSILMDRIQFSLEYPQMSDTLIALAVLAKYTLIGVAPEVIPTLSDLAPMIIERTPQQNATDRAYLRELAAPHGYMFHVRPGPEPMTNIAYWGPPLNIGSVKPALSVDLGATTNVDRISFRLDSLAPVQLYGIIQDNETEIDAPLLTLGSSRMPPLASDPALNPLGLLQRRDIFTDPRLGYIQALVSAQATTDMSTDQAVTAQGEVDTLRYGAVLEAPGLVDVRGAGTSYDGRYRIKTVTHSLARGRYQQSFSLAREGTGSTIDRVAA